MVSLLQFSDDLRDTQKDGATGNANLLISLQKEYGKERALGEFIKLYNTEESNMINCFAKTKIKVDIDLLRALPWYPFLRRELMKDRKTAIK